MVRVSNRFKGLDVIDRMPEELWIELCNILQEVYKIIPKKKKFKKAERLSEEALQIAKKIREGKSKGEMGIYTQINAEFQRKSQTDKKPFFEIGMKTNLFQSYGHC